jgi:tRNA (Thr-GGU) A37 N-methylase
MPATDDRIELEPIGHVHTAYRAMEDTPIQTGRNPDERGGRPFTGDRLRPVPFLLQDTGQRVGVFATRSPVRPNYLALSLVRVLAVDGCTVEFAGVDLLDGTPVLDVKRPAW